MNKCFLTVRESDNLVTGCMWQDDPDDGPVIPQHEAPYGTILVDPPEPFTREGRRDTEMAYLVDGQIVWRDVQPLVDAIADAVAAIDSAADVARMEVIARQTNTTEYQRAEGQARAFKAAGYPDDDVPSCVASWAKAKRRDGWTARQAADDIIDTADRWYGVLDAIRELRLCAKEDVRHAAGNDDVAARVAQFAADLSNLMKGTA